MMTETVSTPPDDHDAIAALMRWIGTLYHPRHAADECVAVHATAQHYAGQVLEFAYHSARRAPRHQDPELVVFDMLKGLEEHWRTEWRAIPAAARPVDAKEAVLSPPTRARVPQPPPPETGNDTLAPLGARLWRQVENGMDRERLLPTIASRRKVLAKKLDRPLEKNGYRTFVAGCAHTIATGKEAPPGCRVRAGARRERVGERSDRRVARTGRRSTPDRRPRHREPGNRLCGSSRPIRCPEGRGPT